MAFRSSAPGKAILIGEHAAVYGRPALVAAIDRRLTASFTPHQGSKIRLQLESLGVDEIADWKALADYALERRRDWQTFAFAPDPAHFAVLRGHDRAHVVKTALGEAVLAWGKPNGGGALRITSELPIGSGFGSSAACAVALLDLVASLLGRTPDAEELIALGLEVERRQHGTPSGIDNATVTRGGLLWVERVGERLHAAPFDAPGAAEFFADLQVYQTGEPAEATGAVVAEVRARRARDPRAFETRLDAMAEASAGVRAQLLAPSPDPERVRAYFREFQAHLEALGVVPAPIVALVRSIEARGGAAKISGAGSLRGPGAGSLLVLPPLEGPFDLATLAPYPRLPVKLGGPGLRRERDPRADNGDPAGSRDRG